MALQVTRRYNLLLHVDACLGGFVLPFARKLGHPIPPFDFSVKGVTSMSVDTHKFGMAHKGTSVVLYHQKELRQYQYTKITEWTGGLYISPGEQPPNDTMNAPLQTRLLLCLTLSIMHPFSALPCEAKYMFSFV